MKSSDAQKPHDIHTPVTVFIAASAQSSGQRCYHPQLRDGKTDIHRPVCPRSTIRKPLHLGWDPGLYLFPYTLSHQVCSFNCARLLREHSSGSPSLLATGRPASRDAGDSDSGSPCLTRQLRAPRAVTGSSWTKEGPAPEALAPA